MAKKKTKRAKVVKTLMLTFDGVEYKASITRNRLLAIHAAPCYTAQGKKKTGYVLTHLPTMKVVLWTNLKRDAVDAQKQLELLDWSDFASVRPEVEALQRRFSGLEEYGSDDSFLD